MKKLKPKALLILVAIFIQIFSGYIQVNSANSPSAIPLIENQEELPKPADVIQNNSIEAYFGYDYENIDRQIYRMPYLRLKLAKSNGLPMNLKLLGSVYLCRDQEITSYKLRDVESIISVNINKDDGTLKLPGGNYTMYLPSIDSKWYLISFSTKQIGAAGKERSELISVNGMPYSYKRWTPPAKMAGNEYVTIGSTQYDVTRILGKPTKIYYSHDYNNAVYVYGDDYQGESIELIEVDAPGQYSVVGWKSRGKLKVSVGTADPKAPAFKRFSTKQEVVKAMGTPSEIELSTSGVEIWAYSDSKTVGNFTTKFYNYVYFKDDRVQSWQNDGNLKVNIGNKVEKPVPIKLGSTRQDVINAMGTPTKISDGNTKQISEWWQYGESSVHFNEITGGVDSFYNAGNLNINIGSIDPKARPFTLGSSKDDVIKANGTPREISSQLDDWGYWVYGNDTNNDNSIIYFGENDKVISYTNYGHLNVSVFANPKIKKSLNQNITRSNPAEFIYKLGREIKNVKFTSSIR